MKPKTFVILIVLFCALGLAAFFTSRQDRSRQQTQMGTQLLADLPINDVAQIRVQGPENGVELKKGPTAWVVENRFGYPADFDKIAGLVKTLRGLKVGRTFKADPKVRERLSLFIPDEAAKGPAEKKGTRIILLDKDGKLLADLLIGKARQAGSGGRHLMQLEPSGNDTVYLVDSPLRFIGTGPDSWLSTGLLDIKSGDVEQVACFDMKTGNLIYRLLRPERGKAPAIEHLAEKESGDPAKIDRVVNALTGLAIDGVAGGREAVALATLENPRRFEYRLFNGAVYTIETGKRTGAGGDKNYLTVSVSYQPSALTVGKEAEKVAQDTGDEARGETAEKIQRLDERIRPWTYTISTWKYEALVSNRTGLLKPEG